MNLSHGDPSLTLSDALLGGPGLDAYAFNAALYCVDCGQRIILDVYAKRGNAPLPWPDELDSEILPQPVFFGESDTAQHCDDCGQYLYGSESED